MAFIKMNIALFELQPFIHCTILNKFWSPSEDISGESTVNFA